MIDKKSDSQSLSMNRFKAPNGDLKPIMEMSAEEKIDFVLAIAMKQVIEVLEVSISQDRIFNRAKFSVMKIFHESRDKML